MMLRRRNPKTIPDYYKGVPVVDLLTVESRKALRLFGAEGTSLWVRLALLVVMAAGAAVYLYATSQVGRYEDLEATALRRASSASADIDEANLLLDEIDALKTTGNLSQRDFEFLLGEPQSLIAAIQSVISLEVTGVAVLSVESSPPDSVDVRLRAATNFAALEWRRLIGSAPGVDRVLSFDPVLDETLVYDVRLISGGE